jgi:hypothetical protein
MFARCVTIKKYIEFKLYIHVNRQTGLVNARVRVSAYFIMGISQSLIRNSFHNSNKNTGLELICWP